MYVKAKKALGQHFLKDQEIAARIVNSLELSLQETLDKPNFKVNVLEVGPGTGVLTNFLIKNPQIELKLAEIDTESVEYLKIHYPQLGDSLIEGDFLQMELNSLFKGEFMLIGNFPYNISSQIFFKVLEYREKVPQVVGMLQKEVAERLASPPGSKRYGILSVLLQAWYDIEYLFTVNENSFIPPPKVKSAVIRVKRNSRVELGCDQVLFKKIIKTTFNQRRKTIRNSIKPLISTLYNSNIPAGSLIIPESPLLAKRPEQLSVEEFVKLTLLVESTIKLNAN
ncbi:MAG: 16S rRNA (adenine(1518)-N(6)/adenine(1519)-N(6))-dimethyltransferase RsmA [Bacteroidales bacterium]